MAEEIRLVGSFQDNITPKLKKLDREIKAVTKSFTKMQAKLRPIAKDMGTLAMASERVANGLKTQRTGLESNIRALNQYKSVMGKAVSAQKKLKPTVLPTPKPPKTPVPGGMPGGFANGAAMAGAGAFGVTLGSTLSSYIQQGLMVGFDYGRTIIMGAFNQFGAMIGERIEDEMSDIQSAGGMFALDKKQEQGERLFANFTQARNMQELLNRELARSAAALPGATSDYVQSAKQLTDTVFATFAKDKSAFADLAVSLGGKDGGTDTENITKVLSKFTEQSVLLSQGGGKGGMPLGMLLEQLITMESVNVDSMKRRYAQLRKNPLLANMLKDAEAAINEGAAGSAERFKAVMDALNNALPEEVVNSMRRSVDGVRESIRSAFLDPEVGLLGLGRPLESTVKSINSFGQFIDKNGKVVRDASEAAEEQTTVFKLLRDIMAGFGLPLSEIATILPQVFDPLEGLASGLFKLRDKAVEFAQMFDRYSNFFKDQGFEDNGIRASLAAFTNFMADLGGITEVERMANIDELFKEDIDFKTLVPRILKQILDSPIAEMFGEAIGSVMGNIVATIAQIMTGVMDNAETSGLVKGFMSAWNAAGGTDAVKTIFQTIFSTMGQLLLMAVQNFPVEAFVVALIALAPAIIAGLSTALALALPGILSGLGTALSTGALGATIAGWLGAVGPALAGIGTFISATLLPALGAAASAIAAVAAPVLAVAGAVMGLVAIFRHMDFIMSSFGHGLVALGLMIETGFLTIIGNILKFVGNIPGMGGLKKKGQAMLDKAEKNKVKSSERVEKINENTAASLERTASDFEKMGNLFKGRGFTSNQEAGVAPGGPGVQANSFDGALAHLNAFTSSIGNFFTKTIPDAWNAGMEAVGNFFTKTFPDAWNAGMKAIGNFIQSAVDGLVNMVKNTWNGLVNFIKELPYTIGYAIGFTIQSIQNAWNGLVDFFTVTLPTAWSTAVSATIGFLTNAWQGLVNFFTVTLPTAVSTVVNAVKGAFQLFIDWIAGLPAAIGEKIMTFLTFAATIPGKITGFLFDVATAIIDWAKGLPGRIMSSLTGGFIAGRQAASSHDGNTSHTMGLGAAIATENANKPAGSHLVIANSSETVIPAYKGHMAESAFDGMVARSAYSGMGGGGGDVNLGGITVNVTGVNNPTDIANQVAEELLQAIKKSTYTELYST